MESLKIDSNTFLDFKGWDNFRTIKYNTNIMTGFNLEKLANFKIEKTFFEICNKFVEDSQYRENKLLLNKLQVNIISKGYEYTTNLLISFFESIYKKICLEIQQLILDDKFSVNNFNSIYFKSNNRLDQLKYVLSTIDMMYKNKDGKRTEYSFINMVKKNLIFFYYFKFRFFI